MTSHKEKERERGGGRGRGGREREREREREKDSERERRHALARLSYGQGFSVKPPSILALCMTAMGRHSIGGCDTCGVSVHG